MLASDFAKPVNPSGTWNALVCLTARQNQWNGWPRATITPQTGHFAGLLVGPDARETEVSNTDFDMPDGVGKGLSVLQRRGRCRLADLRFGPTHERHAGAITVDPGSGGPLDELVMAGIRSATALVKVAQARVASIRDLCVLNPFDYGLSIGEDVDDLDVEDFYLGGFVTQFPKEKKGRPEVKRLRMRNGVICGRHDHLRAEDALWQDVEIRMEFTNGDGQLNRIGIRDETPSDRVKSRVLRRVHFVGEGLPYYAMPGCGGALVTEGCTLNGEPWEGAQS